MERVGPEVLARLIDEHAARLELYARQWCDSPEDIVQEAFVKLVGQTRAPERVVPWLYRVVRNGALEYRRRATRRRKHEARVARERNAWFCANEGDASAEAAAQALMRLPDEQREVVIARLWGGLTFEEIAEVIDASVSTAHRRYQQGLDTLRALITTEGATPGRFSQHLPRS